MVQMLHEDSECAVLDEGEESEWFKVKTGIEQGDVMSGFIFLKVVDWVMRNTTAGNKMDKLELHIKTRGPGHATHTCKQRRQLNHLAARTGLRINKKKTQVHPVLRINSKYKNRLLIDDQALKEVDKCNYLGANVSKQGEGGDDILNRIIKARVSFMKLKQIWSSN